MLLIIFILIIYLYFFNTKSTSIKDNRIIVKIDHLLKPHLDKITYFREKMYNANIKDKTMLMDLYQDQLEELEDAMSSVLLIFPKRYEKKINNYFRSILDDYKLK